jgi:hypothetical protein
VKSIISASIGAALTLVLAACGAGAGGDKAAIAKACVDGGESDKTCTCMADKLATDLDAKALKAVATAMKAGDEKGGEMFAKLPADQQATITRALMSAGFGCTVGG